jgi:hypothetical protein
MISAAPKTRQGLVQSWIVQIVGTIVLAAAIYAFTKAGTLQLGTMDAAWKPYVLYAVLAAAAPALFYLRHYKRLLTQDLRLERENGGAPHAQARTILAKALTLGGALCELPLALGVLQMLMGGETRIFLGATFITLALRLSYRPFMRNS